MQHSAPSLAAQNKLITLFGYIFAKTGKSNTITSPLSLYACLAMLAEGSSGQTFKELADVLGYANEAEVFDDAMFGALQSLHAGFGKGAIVKISNMLYANKNSLLKPEYVETITTKHNAVAENVDFGDSSTKTKINTAISQATNGLIKECIDQLSSDTECVLVNTIYFKGTWKSQFQKSNTRPDAFTLTDGSTTQVDFMNEKLEATLFSTTVSSYLSLAYEGEKVKFVVELPKSKRLEQLDAGAVIKVATDQYSENVQVSLPKFKFEFKAQLLPILQQLGINGACNGTGLEKMTDSRIALTQVIHQAYIQVDEEGTEAAAATFAIMSRCLPPPVPTFQANSPFFFHIVDSSTSTILFTGAIQKPEYK
jgi:serine protease inhibitor